MTAIRFSPSFDEDSPKYGVSRQHVERALRRPDRSERLMPAGADFPPDVDLTGHLSRPAGAAHDPFTLLVITREEAGVMTVLHAWRIYHSDVPIPPTVSPRDALAFFFERYGLQVVIAGTAGRLFTYAKISLTVGPNRVVQIINPDSHRVSWAKMMRIRADQPIAELALVFALDNTVYCADLAQHGVFLRK